MFAQARQNWDRSKFKVVTGNSLLRFVQAEAQQDEMEPTPDYDEVALAWTLRQGDAVTPTGSVPAVQSPEKQKVHLVLLREGIAIVPAAGSRATSDTFETPTTAFEELLLTQQQVARMTDATTVEAVLREALEAMDTEMSRRILNNLLANSMHIWSDMQSKKVELLAGGSHCTFEVLTRATALRNRLRTTVPPGAEVAVLKLAVGSTKGVAKTAVHDQFGRRFIDAKEQTGAGKKGSLHNEIETVTRRLRIHCDRLTEETGIIYKSVHVEAWAQAILKHQLPADFSIVPAFGPKRLDGSVDPTPPAQFVRFPTIEPLESTRTARLPAVAPALSAHEEHHATQAAAAGAVPSGSIKPLAQLEAMDFFAMAQHAKACGVQFDPANLFADNQETERLKLLGQLDRARSEQERQQAALPPAVTQPATTAAIVRSEIQTFDALVAHAKETKENIVLYPDQDVSDLFKMLKLDPISKNQIRREMVAWKAQHEQRQAELEEEREAEESFKRSYDGMDDPVSSLCYGFEEEIEAAAAALIGQEALLDPAALQDASSDQTGQFPTTRLTITHLGVGLAVGGFGDDGRGEFKRITCAPSRTIPALMARGKDNPAYYLQPDEDCADLADLRQRFWTAATSGADCAGAAAAAPGSDRKRQGSADGEEAAAKKARTDGE